MKKTGREVTLQYMDNDGNLCTITPTKTLWYICYILNGNEMDTRSKEKFCKRFRLPYKQFFQLLNLLGEDERFWWWWKGSCDCSCMIASPLSLLLLGAVCYLGRGWMFDTKQENLAISEKGHCEFFHKFIDYCSTTLFDKYVIGPTSAEKTWLIWWIM